ncbi:hypothetical protein [Acinetobacter shaoyimingii]|uniref:Uncharacterized protein n=1 Tax=Acinetobacter shaoyimingii TaxID=2715164 RepID=A0A6G8RUD7_9GAMM|nr:hypothetical protein [Acinetobacter shaoyimingii]QIO05501.1 hypothetical protein G8E00_05825 [Acinetobacter shaoyimingii]
MKFFATTLSGLFFFFPAFLFAYYLAYAYGMTEVFDHWPMELGVNYPEIVFLGFLEFISVFLDKLIILLKVSTFTVMYFFALFFALLIGIHPSARKKFWNKVDFTHFKLNKYIKKNKPNLLKSMNSVPAAIYFLYFFFMLSTIPIIAKYQQGDSESRAIREQVLHQQDCQYDEAFIVHNDQNIRVKKILCGNSKCLVLDLDNKLARVISPEQYISLIHSYDLKK